MNAGQGPMSEPTFAERHARLMEDARAELSVIRREIERLRVEERKLERMIQAAGDERLSPRRRLATEETAAVDETPEPQQARRKRGEE